MYLVLPVGQSDQPRLQAGAVQGELLPRPGQRHPQQLGGRAAVDAGGDEGEAEVAAVLGRGPDQPGLRGRAGPLRLAGGEAGQAPLQVPGAGQCSSTACGVVTT